MRRRTRTGLVLLLIVAAVPGSVLFAKGAGWVLVRREMAMRQGLLNQIGLACKLYSQNDPEGRWPLRAQDAWLPDLELLDPFLEAPDKQAVHDYLQGRRGVQVCYLGHGVGSDLYGLELLRQYEEGDADKLAGRALPAESTSEQAEMLLRLWGESPSVYYSYGKILPLHEGIERYCVRDNRYVSFAQATMPVCWEMPENNVPAGGNVLFMDGHVEHFRYPSRFPMSAPFISRLRSSMPRFPKEKTALDAFERWACGAPSTCPSTDIDYIFSMDVLEGQVPVEQWTPNIEADGQKGYVVFAGVPLALFPDSADLPESLKERLWPEEARNLEGVKRGPYQEDTFVADMGSGHGFHWFALTTAARQDAIRERLRLTGGDDRLQLLIDHQAFEVMPRLGEEAVPYLESVLNGGADQRTVHRALLALARSPGQASAKALEEAFAADNPKALRNAEIVALEFESRGRDASRLAEATLLRPENIGSAPEIALRAALRKDPRLGFPGIDGLGVLRKLPPEAVEKAISRLMAKEPHCERWLKQIQEDLQEQ